MVLYEQNDMNQFFMKKLLLLLFSICFNLTLFAQYQVTIEAFVLDKKTNQPIPYVNIGFIEKSIGTVSNEDGKFTLIYHEDIIGGKEFLQLSTLGYKTLKVRASQLVKFLTNTNKFYLESSPELLDEVLISNEKRSQIWAGNASISSTIMGYWKDKEALGGEITTRIKIKNKSTKLLDLKFNIIENTTDSIKVRVNVYDYKKNYPRLNILNTNIFHIIKTKKGQESINLQPYNIVVNDDVVIGLELVEVYGNDINFAISASNSRGISFLRLISQDTWRRFSNIGMNFTVLTSFRADKDKQVVIEREKPKKITLYYDISRQMKNRFSAKEFNLLSSYLKALKEVEIKVIKFNNSIKQSKLFNISKGKSDELIDYLKNSDYDGASNFKNILKSNTYNANVVLLFSNGMSNFYPLQQEINATSFSINSLAKANHYLLQKTAFYADGHYLNLTKSSVKLALDFMIKEIEDKTVYTNESGIKYVSKGAIHGKVFTASGPIQGATIRIQNTYIEVQSDVDGFFDIDAKIGDILEVSFLGMEDKKVAIPNSKVFILMKPEGELLDEVELKGTKKSSNKVETAYGKKNKDAIGYAIGTMTAGDIKPRHIYLSDVIRGNFSGVRVIGFGDNARYIVRGGNSSFSLSSSPIFDVDGNIFTSPPSFIMPQQIESISILKSLAATNKYGSEGRNGVFVIKMKRAVWDGDTSKVGSAIVKGNDYLERLPLINSNKQTPLYLTQLQSARTLEAAVNIYKTHKEQTPQLSIPYFLDASDYFMKWDMDIAFTILSNIAPLAYNNPKALKTLAFKLEELDKIEEAKLIYEHIVDLRPKDAQSYRDLALIYGSTGNYGKAMKLYKKMLNNSIRGVDFKGLYKIIANELQHLIALHRSKVDYSNVHADYLKADFKYDLRIVFEWNDPDTEFELQFVNPQKKYYNWTHSILKNKERLLNEIKFGYSSEEFIIDDAHSGEWIINIQSLNQETKFNPTYLKYTVFKNYGLSNETKEVKVIKLFEQQQKVTLDKLLYK
jgi:tetratricopeptide (TPR) repeat protein